MKKFVFILFMVFAVILYIQCSKKTNGQKKTELQDIISSDKNSSNTPRHNKILKKFPPSELDPNRVIVKSFELVPDDPTIRDNIEADIKVETRNVEGIKFYYIFYKNNKIIKEGESNILSSDQ